MIKPCANCKYAVEDVSTESWERVHNSYQVWVGIECSNPDSKYYKALLNITKKGTPQSEVTWKGCELHKEKPAKGQVARFENIS